MTDKKKPVTSSTPRASLTTRPLDILMIASEARPFAKTGGLADVVGALPPALARHGHRVTLVVPRYRGTDVSGATATWADIPFGENRYPVTFHEKDMGGGMTAVLIDAPDLYDRDGLYGDASGDYLDNAFRFAVLSRGALEYARLRGRRFSVMHAHDWQAGLAPVYARTVLADDPVIGGIRSVLTVHNLAFQGNFDARELRWLGLPADLYTPRALEYWGHASALKGGIVFSDVITTVSPTYAREILTPALGFGFDGILADREADLVGILNGIDTEAWNPASDPHVPVGFGPDTLDRKREVKRALLELAGLPSDAAALKRPVIGLVSRLTYQKGFDLMLAAADRLMEPDAAWVMLGSGEPPYEAFWTDLAARYPHRVAARIGFDERLAHLIEAGSDMFLMPSWFEPCGLNQMYSLRYGTLPIVRKVGGLDDTVRDPDEDPRTATGFKFLEFTPEALLTVIERALTAFRNPRRWKPMQRRAMAEDHSWDVSAREYVKVYRQGSHGSRGSEGTPGSAARAVEASGGASENHEESDGIRKGTDPDRRQLRPDRGRRQARPR